MNQQTSLYLDVVRFAAAMVVFVGHVSGVRFTDGLFWQVGPFMGGAVTVFFVLSGFVIGYVCDQREDTPRSYAVARAARIYSVAVPAVILTLLLDAAGQAIRPELYSETWGFSGDNALLKALCGLLFLNRMWFADVEVGSMLPYWSLCYEVWYYVIFGAMMFLRSGWRLFVVACLLLLVGPRIAALFPVWLIGLAAYRLCARSMIGPKAGWAMCLGAPALLAAYQLFMHFGRGGAPLAENLMGVPDLVGEYVIALMIAGHVVGFSAISSSMAPVLDPFKRVIRWCAGASFTIYLFHLPVAQFLTTVTPWPAGAWQTRLMMFAGVLILMFLIAEVTERRKEPWRRLFDRLMSGTAPTARVAAD